MGGGAAASAGPRRRAQGRRAPHVDVPMGVTGMTERRRDPLTGEWRTFATHRQDRTFLPSRADCPLCPGPDSEVPEGFGSDIVVFDNRFPSFTHAPPDPSVAATALYEVARAARAAG